jgi:hypothetical protein
MRGGGGGGRLWRGGVSRASSSSSSGGARSAVARACTRRACSPGGSHQRKQALRRAAIAVPRLGSQQGRRVPMVVLERVGRLCRERDGGGGGGGGGGVRVRGEVGRAVAAARRPRVGHRASVEPGDREDREGGHEQGGGQGDGAVVVVVVVVVCVWVFYFPRAGECFEGGGVAAARLPESATSKTAHRVVRSEAGPAPACGRAAVGSPSCEPLRLSCM